MFNQCTQKEAWFIFNHCITLNVITFYADQILLLLFSANVYQCVVGIFNIRPIC